MNEYERKTNSPAKTDLSMVALGSPLQMIGTQVGNHWPRQMGLGLPDSNPQETAAGHSYFCPLSPWQLHSFGYLRVELLKCGS